MQRLKQLVYIGIVLSFIQFFCLFAEEEKKEKGQDIDKGDCIEKEEISETMHQIVINGNTINYRAVAGTFLLKDEKCKPKEEVEYSFFFIET